MGYSILCISILPATSRLTSSSGSVRCRDERWSLRPTCQFGEVRSAPFYLISTLSLYSMIWRTLRKNFTPPTSSLLIVAHTVIPGPEILIALQSYFSSEFHSPSPLNISKQSSFPFPFHRAGNSGFSFGLAIVEVGAWTVEVLGRAIGGRGVNLGGGVL